MTKYFRLKNKNLRKNRRQKCVQK